MALDRRGRSGRRVDLAIEEEVSGQETQTLASSGESAASSFGPIFGLFLAFSSIPTPDSSILQL
jgi:hypothetical protein